MLTTISYVHAGAPPFSACCLGGRKELAPPRRQPLPRSRQRIHASKAHPSPQIHLYCRSVSNDTCVATESEAHRLRVVRQDRGPAALAFLGDAVWELHVRTRSLSGLGSSVQDYYAAVRSQVCAEAQAYCHDWIINNSDVISEAEHDVLRWGRNTSGTAPRRILTGKLDRLTYRKASAMECLLGALHLTDPARARQLLGHLSTALEGEWV